MSYIRTYTGKHFNYSNIDANEICIIDIAHALSNICRFAGHVPQFYSVAQHSVLISRIVPPEFALEALLHDASEAYCQDIPSPLKQLLPDYQRIESDVDGSIRKKYGLPAEMSSAVKHADLVMLATERQDLGLDDGLAWDVLEGIEANDLLLIIPWTPEQARTCFIDRLNELAPGK